jgi:hypothetical protein
MIYEYDLSMAENAEQSGIPETKSIDYRPPIANVTAEQNRSQGGIRLEWLVLPGRSEGDQPLVG